MSEAEEFCADLYLHRIVAASSAPILVAMGDVAGGHQRVFSLPPDGRLHGPLEVGATQRLFSFLPHPNARQRRTFASCVDAGRSRAYVSTSPGRPNERSRSPRSFVGAHNRAEPSRLLLSLRAALSARRRAGCSCRRGPRESSAVKPILKPTGRESMQPRANKRAGVDLRTDARQRHATPKFESPLPHRKHALALELTSESAQPCYRRGEWGKWGNGLSRVLRCLRRSRS